MLLAIDIGNTNVTIGAFDGERLVASWRVATNARKMADEYTLELNGLLPMKGVPVESIRDVSMCSVVPPLTGVFVDVVRHLFNTEPLVVGAGTRTGVKVMYDNPRDVGADRVVDTAAAYQRYGGPAIVVDFGTATVFDAIASDGTYLGGAISPGLHIAAESLFLNTSQLRRVELQRPQSAIGKNTVHAMQSGLVFGYIGLVEAMVQRFKDEMDAPTAKVIATGGLASLMSQETSVVDVVDEDLTLRGLQYVHALNAVAADDASPGGQS
jgi:type III pantothenate kinase